jgi:hypothetical protein
MNRLFTDDNPSTTIQGLGFKTPEITRESIKIIEKVLNRMRNEQKIGYSNRKLRPCEKLDSQQMIDRYYKKQKMYRALGLLNRAKVIFKRYPSNNLKLSIKILEKYMKKLNI